MLDLCEEKIPGRCKLLLGVVVDRYLLTNLVLTWLRERSEQKTIFKNLKNVQQLTIVVVYFDKYTCIIHGVLGFWGYVTINGRFLVGKP